MQVTSPSTSDALQICTIMPETSDRDPPAGTEDPTLEPPARDAREREATELAALRRQYSRASSYNRPRLDTPSRDPETPLGRFTSRLVKFWGRQVSVIVPHESCRDHLGMGTLPASRPVLFLQMEYATGGLPLPDVGSCIPRCKLCTVLPQTEDELRCTCSVASRVD
jgi:hypothetical protein